MARSVATGFLVLCFTALGAAVAQDAAPGNGGAQETAGSAPARADDRGFVRIKPEDLVWRHRDSGPDTAVVYGDPAKEGFYIIRVRFAPHTHSEPHYHPHDRHVTVLSGTWYTGTGSSGDMAHTVPLGPGSYMFHPAGAVHYDGAMDEEVVLEIKGMGPAPSIPAPR
ncbi:MAG TPA: cupin domain-containing protein [Gammaproteobacteria bacterium]|nr:cupin domain-containing protein [Gammaproteobacteria bacterium]